MIFPVSVLPTYATRNAIGRTPATDPLIGPYRTVWSRPGAANTAWPLPLNVYATPEMVQIVAAVPGLQPEDIDITVDQNTLTFRGQFSAPAMTPEAGEATWYLREIWSGRFQRSVPLPFEVEADQAQASFEHGLLTVTLPKAEHARPHKIQVHVAETPRELAAMTPQANGA